MDLLMTDQCIQMWIVLIYDCIYVEIEKVILVWFKSYKRATSSCKYNPDILVDRLAGKHASTASHIKSATVATHLHTGAKNCSHN